MAKGQNVGYKRVSTILQNTDRQLDGIDLDTVFEDKASGADRDRPELKRCIQHCRGGDILHIHSIDRLARDTANLLEIVDQLLGMGVEIRFHKENLTFTPGNNSVGTLMLTIISAIAQFEREMILERQREGIAIAKSKGKPFGRKPKLEGDTLEEFLFDVARGKHTRKELAEKYGCGKTTVYQTIKDNQEGIVKYKHENFELKQTD